MATAVAEVRKTRWPTQGRRARTGPLKEAVADRVARVVADAEVAAARHVADLPKMARAEAKEARRAAAAAAAAAKEAKAVLDGSTFEDDATRVDADVAYDKAVKAAVAAAHDAQAAEERAKVLADPSSPEAVAIANRARAEDVLTAVSALGAGG